jgi:hypothetical protein
MACSAHTRAGCRSVCAQVAVSLTIVGSVLGLGAISKEVAALEDACQFETLKQVGARVPGWHSEMIS